MYIYTVYKYINKPIMLYYLYIVFLYRHQILLEPDLVYIQSPASHDVYGFRDFVHIEHRFGGKPSVSSEVSLRPNH